ncbi:MAG TPA: acyl carrier protein [Gammaproteobacteria bacterium]|nr:acyl carrier protein [Gammaproteobacteria bacterium]
MSVSDPVKEKLLGFVVDELLNGEPLASDDNLLGDGVVSSLGMMRLVGFIEESYAIKVPPEHFIIENFQTVDAISTYLTARSSAVAKDG